MYTRLADKNYSDAAHGDARWLRISTGDCHTGLGSQASGDSLDHYTIFMYTLQAGEQGDIALDSSRLAKVSGNGNGVDLEVYVNDTHLPAFSLNGYNSTSDTSFDGGLGTFVERLADLRQFDVDDIAKLLLGVVGDADRDDVAIEANPFMVAGIAGCHRSPRYGLGLR